MATNSGVKHPYEDDQRNINFGVMLDYIKRNYDDINTQNDLATFLGVSKDTISNIKQGNTTVSDDFISKVMQGFEGVFNIHWLKGRSPIMLQKDVSPEEKRNSGIDQSSLVNATIAAKDSEIAAKDKTIASLEREIKTKDDMIDLLRERVSELKEQRQQSQPLFPMGVAEP